MSKQILEAVARAIWDIRREYEDRCDMELEDLGSAHSVWLEAKAAIEAIDGTECDAHTARVKTK
ncbi:MAG: hypothetical protein J6D44_00495 [Pseudomonas sp.]|nr:hypothetical protein [Pseudomonas sp.]